MARKVTTEMFIERAQAVHGDLFDYSRAQYAGVAAKLEIVCRKHGSFWMLPFNHTRNKQGCSKCTTRTGVTAADFIQKAVAVWGTRFNYDKSTYTRSGAPIIITCSVHGPITFRRASDHIKRGCPQCLADEAARCLDDPASFVARAREVHGQYTYEKVHTSRSHAIVTITCPTHGDFPQDTVSHLQGAGCPKCGSSRGGQAQSLGTDGFITAALAKHGDLHKYDQVAYRNNHTPVSIGCNLHGIFKQRPSDHLNGAGCPKCGDIRTASAKKKDHAHFLTKAREVHGDRYSYTGTGYAGCYDKVAIVCPEHGPFQQSPKDHVSRATGCPKCGGAVSKAEGTVADYLESFLPEGTAVVRSTRKVLRSPLSNRPLELDMYIPSLAVAIEFNGTYYHSVPPTTPRGDYAVCKHRMKSLLCRDLGIQLLHIDELDWYDPAKRAIWKSILQAKLRRTPTRIGARQCTRGVPTKEEARTFLRENHLQGSCAVAEAEALYDASGIAALIVWQTPSARTSGTANIVLARFCVRKHTSVAGGFTRLLLAYRRRNPRHSIVTYSDNAISGGDLYERSGFTATAKDQMDYIYLGAQCVKLRKGYCTRANLRKNHPDVYDDRLSEAEMAELAGYRRLYNAGRTTWVLSDD